MDMEAAMKSYKYIIVGGGMAGDSAVQGIREVDKTGSIALIGAESFPPYIRPPLTKGLWTGKKKLEDIWRQTAAHQVDLYLNQRVTAIDAHKKVVTDDQGLEFEYERLLLATGGGGGPGPFSVKINRCFFTPGEY